MVAFYSGIRHGEHHALSFEDVSIDDVKKEVRSLKGNQRKQSIKNVRTNLPQHR